MRHNRKFNHLSRTAAHRHAMLSNMAVSLLMHKRITTTVAKAKALKKYVEPLITRSKEDTTNSRRVVFSYLQDKAAVTELFKNISVKVGDRPGGYTRIIKTGIRQNDAAAMCFIELVDYDDNMAKTTLQKKLPQPRKQRPLKKLPPLLLRKKRNPLSNLNNYCYKKGCAIGARPFLLPALAGARGFIFLQGALCRWGSISFSVSEASLQTS